LAGIEKWAEFQIDGIKNGQKWEGVVLLCGNRTSATSGCARIMDAYIAGDQDRPPGIRTFRGGRVSGDKMLSGSVTG
jgi:hypothetical protein